MIHNRKLKCVGCGESRPCIIETNQEMDGHFDELDHLKCILDNTNSSYKWEDLQESQDKIKLLLTDVRNSNSCTHKNKLHLLDVYPCVYCENLEYFEEL